MELTHSFTVPGPPAETWDRFQDIASLAECFPGAQVTSFSGDSFEGTVKVKLGPIALVYAGSGSFVSKDEAARSFVVEAKGRDKRGNGTAGATVTVSMSDAGGSTEVSVRTDLSITGKPAQFGRGVMQDVSDKLLGQFVACLEQRSGEPASAEPAGGGSPEPVAEPVAEAVSEPVGGAPVVAPPEPADAPAAAPAGAARPAETARPAEAARPVGGPPPGGDALDLGATVLPVLVKGYWRQAVGGLAVVALIVWLVRRLT